VVARIIRIFMIAFVGVAATGELNAARCWTPEVAESVRRAEAASVAYVLHPAQRVPADGLRLAQYGAASRCFTQFGWCWLAYPLPAGVSCYCPSVYGPVWGLAG
jgi:hypothetical protein